MSRRILTGTRVLDVTQLVAGPLATRMLADLGADVVRIDPPGPDDGSPGPRRSAGAPSLNLGKRSIVLDLKHPAGLGAARQLAAAADVLVENYLPGVLDRLGLGYDHLVAANPRIIYASISGFGHGNSQSHRRAFGATAHAEAGWLWVQQRAQGGDAPFAPGITVADIVTGMNAFSGILAALYDRERNGKGHRLDITLMESQLAMLTEVASGPLAGEPEERWQPFRHGLQRTKDGGHLAVNIGGPHNWARLASALGHQGEPMPADPRQANALLDSWIAEHSTEDAARVIEASGAPYGVMRSIYEAIAAPYFAERGMITTVNDPLLGTTRVVGSPLRFRGVASGPLAGAPLAGQHTREVLAEAGFEVAAIGALLAEGAAAEQPPG